MLSKFKNKIIALFVGSFSIVLAACYGVPVVVDYVDIKTINADNEPIAGLEVSLINNGEEREKQISDETGTVVFNDVKKTSENNFSFIIKDIDGEKNGEYKTKEIKDFDNNNVFIME